MFLRAAVCPVLLAYFAIAAPPEAGDDPLVDIIKEAIFEVNQHLAQQHLDFLKMPDIGVLPWDPVKLRNGHIGNFSTLELRGDPDVRQEDNPDGSTTISFDLQLGLGQLEVLYDFSVNVLKLITREGNVTISTQHDTAKVKGTLFSGANGKCKARLSSLVIPEFGDYVVSIHPDDFPMVAAIEEAILNCAATHFLPLTNLLLNTLIKSDILENAFSKIVCKYVPI